MGHIPYWRLRPISWILKMEGRLKHFKGKGTAMRFEGQRIVVIGGSSGMGLAGRSGGAAFDSKFWGQNHAAKHGAPKIRPGGFSPFFPTWSIPLSRARVQSAMGTLMWSSKNPPTHMGREME